MGRRPKRTRSMMIEAGKPDVPGELTSQDKLWLARHFALCESLDPPRPPTGGGGVVVRHAQ
jgi:hypothetical protein